MYRGKTVYSTTHKSAHGPHRRDVTHIYKLFFIEILSFSKVNRNDRFFPIQIPIFQKLHNNADTCRCSYFELGLPVVSISVVKKHLSESLALRYVYLVFAITQSQRKKHINKTTFEKWKGFLETVQTHHLPFLNKTKF